MTARPPARRGEDHRGGARRGRLAPAPEAPDAWISPVDDPPGLADLLERMGDADRYGFDTEFHREKTYHPRVALVQMSWRDVVTAPGSTSETHAALVDPVPFDIAPLAELLRRPATMVVHAAEQDLEILHHVCGTGPSSLFDTQIAAGFAGHSSASLADLVGHYLGFELPKADRLTDWSARPLQDSQLRYAVADVAFLLDLEEAIREDLDRRGRLAWAEEECELLLRKAALPPDPDRAWWRLRSARQLRGTSRGVAQAVAGWRDLRARRLDLPPRFVLPDLALQALIHRPPSDRRQLDAVRGMDPRFLRDGAAEEILEAVRRGLGLPADAIRQPPADEVPKDLRPAVSLAMAWIGQVARDEAVDSAALATRSDVVQLLLGRGGRLYEGWRAELVGEPIWRLVAGFASIAYDGAGNLVLEERSGRPLGSDDAGVDDAGVDGAGVDGAGVDGAVMDGPGADNTAGPGADRSVADPGVAAGSGGSGMDTPGDPAD